MYKVFVNDKPIILTTEVEKEGAFKNYLLKSVNLRKVIRELNTTSVKEVRIIHHKKEKLLKKFLKKLPNVIAGGGLVKNKKGEVLFIFRNGKWDLPKGKTEKKEPIEASAIREVEEETGVRDLSITKPLETTYHIFKRNGRYRIKITYWFEMYTEYDGPCIPEESEGITKVAWLNSKEIDKALKNSYANIKSLIES
jgi:8-oxo-dGTP pyrophosphatase MutT (NUDIX family)